MRERWMNNSEKGPCPQCAVYVGRTFAADEGPFPPLHPGCTCERIPEELAPMSENQFRMQPSRGITGQVDRENRIIHGVSCAEAVEALGHDCILDGVTLSQIVELGNAPEKGIKARYTHPGLSSDGLGKYLGRLRNFRLGPNGDKALADLHISETARSSPSGNLADYVLDLAEKDPDMFGMSIVFKGPTVWQRANGEELDSGKHQRPADATTDKPLVRVQLLRACDCVDEPAANRAGLFSLSQRDTNGLAQQLFEEIDKTIHQIGIDHDHAWRFARHYFHERGISMDEMNEVSGKTASQPGVQATGWESFLQSTALDAAMQVSGLPGLLQDAVRRNLSGRAVTPEMITGEIGFQRKLQSELAPPPSPVKGIHPILESHITTVGDELQGAFDWLFGVPGAPVPRPHLRKLSDLYQVISGDHDWHGVFRPDLSQFASANSTTMAGMATNSVNKAVQSHYENQETYRWFENIVEVVAHDGSTHDVDLVYVDGFGVLPVVAEGGAYTEATAGDSKESMTFAKRGVYVGITLELIRKNNVQKAREIIKNLVLTSVRTRSGRIAQLFTQASGTGPTLADDSTVLFHSNHGNIGTTAFSAAEWAVCRRRIWEQAIPGTSLPLGLWPRFALLPVELYDTALEVFGYGAGDVGRPSTAGTAQAVNPYAQSRQRDPRPIPLAVPEFTDANDFAYITDPVEHAPIKMAYANQMAGSEHPAPEVFQVSSESSGLMFSNDTLPVKIRDWFAFGVATYVGVGKANVA